MEYEYAPLEYKAHDLKDLLLLLRHLSKKKILTMGLWQEKSVNRKFESREDSITRPL